MNDALAPRPPQVVIVFVCPECGHWAGSQDVRGVEIHCARCAFSDQLGPPLMTPATYVLAEADWTLMGQSNWYRQRVTRDRWQEIAERQWVQLHRERVVNRRLNAMAAGFFCWAGVATIMAIIETMPG